MREYYATVKCVNGICRFLMGGGGDRGEVIIHYLVKVHPTALIVFTQIELTTDIFHC